MYDLQCAMTYSKKYSNKHVKFSGNFKKCNNSASTKAPGEIRVCDVLTLLYISLLPVWKLHYPNCFERTCWVFCIMAAVHLGTIWIDVAEEVWYSNSNICPKEFSAAQPLEIEKKRVGEVEPRVVL